MYTTPTVFSVTGGLAPSFVLVKFRLPCWLSVPLCHHLTPQQPLQYIYVSRPVRERTAFLSSNAWQREHSKDGISTYPWESSRGGGWLGFDIAATSTLNCTKRSWSTEGDFVPCIGPPHSARKQLCFRTQRGILDKGEREQLRSSSNIFLEDIFVAEPFAYCTLH